MKKLFALFLLVALVPFTVGCGLFGDNDDTSPITTSTLTLARLFPAGSFSGSLRGATTIALNYSDLFMMVEVKGTKIKLSYKKHTNKAAGVEVEFAAPVLPSVIEEVKGTTVTVEVQIQPVGVTQPAVVVPAAAITVPSTLTSGTTATALESTPITTVKTDAEILTEIKTENPTISDPVIAEDYKVTSVLFGTTSVSQVSTTPTPITAVDGKYTFTVYFNQAYTNTAAPTFSIEVANATTKTLTGTPVAVTWATDKKSATVVVTTDATYKLTTGQDYTVTLKSTDAVGTSSVKATLPGTFYVLAQ